VASLDQWMTVNYETFAAWIFALRARSRPSAAGIELRERERAEAAEERNGGRRAAEEPDTATR
jgi:hypothetical protein